jgi:hypothetical protein
VNAFGGGATFEQGEAFNQLMALPSKSHWLEVCGLLEQRLILRMILSSE